MTVEADSRGPDLLGRGGTDLLPRNDPRQYDELADDWWDPAGCFAMLHWLAASRATVLPAPSRAGALLVDVACGGGLLAPHVARAGYRHVGVDIGLAGLRLAASHGVRAVQGDALHLPLPDACADVVVAGEVFEHIPDLPAVTAEVCRVMRPGGTVVLDTIAATWFGRVSSITVGERLPGGPPQRLHDPALFVDRAALAREFGRHGVGLTLTGLRPPVVGYARWLLARALGRAVPTLSMAPTRLTAGLFQATGVRAPQSVTPTTGPAPTARQEP